MLLSSDQKAFLYQRVSPILPTMFRVDWPFSSGHEGQNIFSRWPPWRPSWVFDQNNLAFCICIPHTMFPVNLPIGSGEEAQSKFSRWRLSWISD